MKSFKTVCFFVSILFTFSVWSQQYENTYLINQQDSSSITASCFSENGNILTATIQNRKFPTGGSGIPSDVDGGSGTIVVREITHDGTEIWSKVFPNSTARITHIRSLNNQIFISGCYYDSLELDINTTIFAAGFRSNAFIACLDNQGNHIWNFTTIADPSFHKYFFTFDFWDNKIYIPYYEAFGSATYVQTLNLMGDSLTNVSISNETLFINQFQFDTTGNIYLNGTTSPTADISGTPIGTDTTTIGYETFIIKIDNNFQHLWSRNFLYMTFDMHPLLAFNENRIAFMYDTIPNQSGIGNHHVLSIFDLDGNYIFSDSVGPTVFTQMHNIQSLASIQNSFILSTIAGFDTSVLYMVDDQHNLSELARLDFKNNGEGAQLIANDSLAFYLHTFRQDNAVINHTDTLWNPKDPLYEQQLMMKFSFPENLSISENEISINNENWMIYPNPSKGIINIQNQHEENIKAELFVYNLNGKLIKTTPFSRQIELNLSELPATTYLIAIKTKDSIDRFLWVKN